MSRFLDILMILLFLAMAACFIAVPLLKAGVL